MSSRYSPSGLLWESVKFQTSKYKILISISVALVFIITLIVCIAIREERNDSTVENSSKPQSQGRPGAKSPTGNIAVDEPSRSADVTHKGIYLATYRGMVNFFTPASRNVTTIYRGNEDLRGITYDPVNSKLYWSSARKVYRGNMNGSEQARLVFNTTFYNEIKALAYDWLTGNVYGVCFSSGYIFACNTKASPMVCATVLSNQGQPNGIALNPTEGRMYWTLETQTSIGQIRRAEMDGSGVTVIKTGLRFPYGITIDYPNSRLYWTDFGADNIGTANLDGSSPSVVFRKSSPRWHGYWGIALLNDRIYWSTRDSMKLESCNKNGTDVRMEYQGERENAHLVSTGMELSRNKMNHCASRICPKLCVLTATSARCLH